MHERHGASKTRLYKIWCGMRDRCYRTNHSGFVHYGARGIAVCDEWRESFSAFQRWALSNGYRSDKTIDRINNDGHYQPDNCRWATRKAQARNKGEAKSHLVVEYDGKRMNLLQWSKFTGIYYNTLIRRYKTGKRGAALFKPTRVYRSYCPAAAAETGNGNAKLTEKMVEEIKSSRQRGFEIAKRYGVSQSLVSMIRSGARR